MDYKIKPFGSYKGINYDEIYITNDNNTTFVFTNLGARITKLLYPYEDEHYNLVLGFLNSEEAFLGRDYYYGATIGRVAGRIKSGNFSLGNHVYKLQLNDGNNHLHGGKKGLDVSKWEYEIQKYSDQITLSFYLKDSDGNNGYPGNIKIKVHHTINNKNQWQIKYEGVSDIDTIFDPTNHVYFNLNKNKNKSILNHKLKIDANYYVPVDKNTIPLSNGENVKKTVFDFTQSKLLSDILQNNDEQVSLMNGLDHAFILNKNSLLPDVYLENTDNNIKIKMETDRPAVIIFSHNKIHKDVPTNYGEHCGITMEAQSLPNSINIDSYREKVILRNGKKFESTTTYTFLNE